MRRGPRGGTPITDGCWCQYWHVRGKAYGAGWSGNNRRRLRTEVREGPPPGLIAYVDGRAVGWCRLGPRDSFERLTASPALAPVDDLPVWSVVCFYVHPSAKRTGIASALLEAAAEYARAAGAPALEAYAARANQTNIDAYTGYLPMFDAAGFERVGDGGRRTVVRRAL